MESLKPVPVKHSNVKCKLKVSTERFQVALVGVVNANTLTGPRLEVHELLRELKLQTHRNTQSLISSLEDSNSS